MVYDLYLLQCPSSPSLRIPYPSIIQYEKLRNAVFTLIQNYEYALSLGKVAAATILGCVLAGTECTIRKECCSQKSIGHVCHTLLKYKRRQFSLCEVSLVLYSKTFKGYNEYQRSTVVLWGFTMKSVGSKELPPCKC